MGTVYYGRIKNESYFKFGWCDNIKDFDGELVFSIQTDNPEELYLDITKGLTIHDTTLLI